MKSIRSVYKIGHGPSSSHTVGPYRAARIMGRRYPEADTWQVTLCGSLAFTGEGHGTGKAILAALPGAEIIFNREEENLPHPNTMIFTALKDGKTLVSKRIFSVGGGSIRIEGESSDEEKEVYPQNSFSEILGCCKQEGISLTEFIYRCEGEDIRNYLSMVWGVMQEAIQRGLKAEGVLPGGLGVSRKAKLLFEMRCYNENADVTMNRLIAAYAYAVSEENADENLVVTAPTCGSSGVLPAVLYYMQHDRGFPENEILDALAVGGIIGNLIPIPFILFLFSSVLEWMKGVKVFRPFALWLERHILNRREQIEKYEFWGLVLFVGIPLPGTGAWTGSGVAALLHMDKKKAFLAILLGVAIATVIMSIISYGLLGALFG